MCQGVEANTSLRLCRLLTVLGGWVLVPGQDDHSVEIYTLVLHTILGKVREDFKATPIATFGRLALDNINIRTLYIVP